MSMYRKPTAVSARTAAIENPTIRRLYEGIERERVRQGVPLFDLGTWNRGLTKNPHSMAITSIVDVLDELDIDIVLVNREGDQV